MAEILRKRHAVSCSPSFHPRLRRSYFTFKSFTGEVLHCNVAGVFKEDGSLDEEATDLAIDTYISYWETTKKIELGLDISE